MNMSNQTERARRCPPLAFCPRAVARVALGLGLSLLVAACEEPPPPAAEIRPVRTVVVEPQTLDDSIALTGEIRARYESDLGFRVGGKIVARTVDVGTTVKAGDVLARLDEADARNALEVARAAVTAAQATVDQQRPQRDRQKYLLDRGWTTRVDYELAVRNLQAAEAQLQEAQANAQFAQDQLSYTTLAADHDGIVTAVGAEVGQVVSAGQMVARVARPGEREAVFNVAETRMSRAANAHGIPVEVSLLGNPQITTVGSVREVSPSADPVTRTYTVKIALPEAPEEMRLGMTVTGRVQQRGKPIVALPPTALFQKDGAPAVWTVADGNTVRLRPVTVLRYDTDRVLVSGGLDRGDIVVTAGVNVLADGQKVRLMETASR